MENNTNPSNLTSIQLTVDLREHEDPRIKSPDDILLRLAPRKVSLQELQATPEAGDKTAVLARELAELRARHDQEISQWKDYERRIQEWRSQVVSIVEGLRSDKIALQKKLDALRQDAPSINVLD